MHGSTEALCECLRTAGKPEDVFGTIDEGSVEVRLASLKHLFTSYLKKVHPDQNPTLKDAGRFVDHLVAFRKEAERFIRDGSYGKARKVEIHAVLHSKLARYTVQEVYRVGEVADLLLAENEAKERRLLKVTRVPSDNDLLDNEARVLADLHRRIDEKAKVFQKYLPKLIESFPMIQGASHQRVNVLDIAAPAREYAEKLMEKKGLVPDPNYYSLAEIRGAYPDGLDAQDVAWMIRRAFEGIGWVHSVGYVHGALVPEHILVHPTEHGARLVGWSYAVQKGYRLKALPASRKAMYPSSVMKKEPIYPVLDIQLLGATALLLLSDKKGRVRTDVPANVEKFFERCRIGSVRDGWDAYREYDVVLKNAYGKRRYRAFAMPPGT